MKNISEKHRNPFVHAFCAGIECMYFKEYNRAGRTGKAPLVQTDTEVRRSRSCDGIPVRRNRRRKTGFADNGYLLVMNMGNENAGIRLELHII
ncbi:MAG: hypothetical protein ACLVBJ_08970 [Pilosibacter sp.]